MRDMVSNSENNYPRLVGGTFLCILLQYKKWANEEGNDYFEEFLKALGGAKAEDKFNSITENTASTQITLLKRCKSNAFRRDFLSVQYLKDQSNRISEVCDSIKKFFEEYVEEDGLRNFVADLLQMIVDNPQKNESFLLNKKNHEEISRDKIINAKQIFLPFIPFVTRVALYAFSEENLEGHDTLLSWGMDDEDPSAIIQPEVESDFRNMIHDSETLKIIENATEKGGSSSEQSEYKNSNKAIVFSVSLQKLKQDSVVASTRTSDKVVPPPPFRRQNVDDEAFFYRIDERDYQALEKQANNTERDQRDLNILLAEIKRKKKLYVKTDVYRETYSKIQSMGYVLLVGNPGTGKSMTSELVALKFAGTGEYIVHYLRDYDEADVNKLFDEISSPIAKDEKHFILIDDCMGQAFYELDNAKEKGFYKLVTYITMKSQRLKLLLNSRINIVEASKQHRIYERVFDDMFKTKRIVDANKLSKKEKALILRAHVVANSDKDHYDDIKGKRAVAIVNHDPYIPRVIYHVTAKGKPIRESGDFFEEIISALDNPSSIWEEIYDDDKATPPEARILLKALFSLTNNMVELKICKTVFHEYLRLSELKTDPRKAWGIALRSLNASMIKREVGDEDMIGFADPSVHDYLLRSIYYSNSYDWDSLFAGVVHRQQIDKLYGKGKDNILDILAKDGRIMLLEYRSELEKNFEVCDLIAMKGYCLHEYKEVFNRTLRYLSFSYNYGSAANELFRYARYDHLGDRMLIVLMRKTALRKFYCNGKINRRVYDACTTRSDLLFATSIIEEFYKTGSNCFDFDFDIKIMKKLITDSCDRTELYIDDYIRNIIDDLDTDNISVLNSEINIKVHDVFCGYIRLIHDYVPNDIYEGLYDAVNEYDSYADYTAEIGDFLNNHDYDDYDEDYYREMYDFGCDEDRAVEEVFDKPFDE